jgi:hypothetical protein
MGILSFSFRIARAPLRSFFVPVQSAISFDRVLIRRHSKALGIGADDNDCHQYQSSRVNEPACKPLARIEVIDRTDRTDTTEKNTQIAQVSTVKNVQSIVCSCPSKPSQLKIVRLFEPGVSASCAGRMLISGRMADVCAELDRMEQRSTGNHQTVSVN